MTLSLTYLLFFSGQQYGFSAAMDQLAGEIMAGFDLVLLTMQVLLYLALLRLFWWVMKLRI